MQNLTRKKLKAWCLIYYLVLKHRYWKVFTLPSLFLLSIFLSLIRSQTHTYGCLKRLVFSDRLITGSFVYMDDFIHVLLKLGTLKRAGLHITIKMFYHYKNMWEIEFFLLSFYNWHLLANKFFLKRILLKGKML